MRVLRVLAGLTAVMLLSGAAPSYASSGRDSWSVPASGTVTLRGHGYGHGHGMSQWGAEGAARRGHGWRQIVGFYYPGTTRARVDGRITVALSSVTGRAAGGAPALVVEPRHGLSVRDRAGTRRITLPDNGARAWRVAVTGSGRDRVSFLTGRWHRWRDLRGAGEFYAGGRPIEVLSGSGGAYRGRIRLVPSSGGSSTRVVVNDLELDAYVRGVVPLESPASWHPAALEAQAVAARTYAAYERAHPLAATHQICDTTSCQVYGGASAEQPTTNRAVARTAGRILTSGGRPAFTQFSASNGGWTAAGDVAYLPAQRDPFDGWSGNPVHTWDLPVSTATLERAWPVVGDLRRISVTARDGNGAWGGRVRYLRLDGTGGKVLVSGETVRSVLGLRSTWFTVRSAG